MTFIGLFVLRSVFVRATKAIGQKIKNLRAKKVRLEGEEVSWWM